MLIVYRASTGEVLDNSGTSSAAPLGPPDSAAFINTDARGVGRTGLATLRLHDVDDAATIARIMTSNYQIDPTTKKVVITGARPAPVTPPNRDALLAAALRASTTWQQCRDAIVADLDGRATPGNSQR